jgi:hypothetical protein
MDWTITNQPRGTLPVIGATYQVRHRFRGIFTLTVTKVNNGWIYGEVHQEGTNEVVLDAVTAGICTLTLKD